MKDLYKSLVAIGFVLFLLLIAIAQSNATPDIAPSSGTTATPVAIAQSNATPDIAPLSETTATPGMTATLLPPTKIPSPTLVPSSGKPLPPCTFPLLRTLAPEDDAPAPQSYVFSKPRVVLTHALAIGVAGWLPDSRRLLITKDVPGTNRQVIEIFDTQTREEFVYAERYPLTSPPGWLASQESVVFMDSTMEEGKALRLSHNLEGPVETLRTHLASSSLAVDSTGEKVAFLIQDQGARPAVMDLPERMVHLFEGELPLSSIRTPESIYRITWNPRGNECSGPQKLDTKSWG